MHSTGKEQQERKDVACPFSRAFSPSLAIDLRHLGGLLFTNAISPTELASLRMGPRNLFLISVLG